MEEDLVFPELQDKRKAGQDYQDYRENLEVKECQGSQALRVSEAFLGCRVRRVLWVSLDYLEPWETLEPPDLKVMWETR